jgi:hypothetical protein
MRNRLWLWAIVLSVGPIVVGSTWGAAPPEQRIKAFSNREFGTPRLGKFSADAAAKVPKEVQTAWENLKSQKGPGQAKIVFSQQTGLPHSIHGLKIAVEGASQEEKATNFLAAQNILYLKGEGLSNLKMSGSRKDAFTGAGHVDFLQYYKALRVYGAGLCVHFDQDENVVMVNGDYIPDLAPANGEPASGELTADEALKKALKRLPPFPMTPLKEGELVIFAQAPAQGGVYLAYRYELLSPLPEGHRILFVDAYTGTVLSFFSTTVYANGSATIFDPNARQPAPVERTLTDLDGTGFLRGPLQVIVDEESDQAQSQSNTFNFSLESTEFIQPSVYYYLTETRKRLRQYGFDDAGSGALPAHINTLDKATGLPLDNAYYFPLGVGFVFGNGAGTRIENISRDFDFASHEFGHFVDDWLNNPNMEQTPRNTPIRAWGEACGDTIASIMGGDPNVAESVIPGQSFMRTVDNTKRFPNDLVNQEHADGEIFGGSNWDFMELRGGGSVTPAAREELAKVLFAGIPFIPPTNVQFNDLPIAFIQGDNTRGGNNVANLRTAYGMHGITEEGGIQKVENEADSSPNSIDKQTGFQELQSGLPVYGSLSNGFFADFYILIPQGATSLTVQTFVPGSFPQGDIELRVAPSTYTGPHEIQTSYHPGTVVESVVIDNPASRDSAWLIEIADNPFDGFFSEVGLVATVEGGGAEIPQIFLDTPVNGTIETPQEFDRYFFQGNAGQTIQLSANKRGNSSLDPLLAIGNSVGQLLVFDDNSGGNGNALISGFTLPVSDNYIVLVQSAITEQGPFSFGDYTLTLSGGTPPGPTPTPGPTPLPGGVTEITPGVPVTGTILGQDPNAGVGGTSEPYKVVVPQGARQLLIRVSESPQPAGNLTLQVRKGQPVGNTLDDYVGLGNRKSSVVVTQDSRVPLGAGEFYIKFFNFAQTNQNFELVATIDTGSVGGNPFDTDSSGLIDSIDLVDLLKGNLQQNNLLFDFARFWKGPAN